MAWWIADDGLERADDAPEENQLVCEATRQNWARLGADGQKKLTARANKRLSDRRILPKEYILCADTLPLIEEISSKVRRNGWRIADVMFSLCAARRKGCGLWEGGTAFLQGEALRGEECPQSAVRTDSSQRKTFGEDICLIEELASLSLPEGEWDILGLIYQSLLSEGEKNRMGAYYTPPSVVRDMVRKLSFEDGQTFLDPCCGSGSYLLGLVRTGVKPVQIFGCDIDPIAVMIAKTNLICECRDEKAASGIVCGDFLKEQLPLPECFDYILTNPPWGAAGKGESFSDFLHRGCEKIGENGVLRFLLPDSFLNVRMHCALRRHLLERACISQIRLYEERFVGVTTGCICVEVRRRGEGMIRLSGRGMNTQLNAQEILQEKDCVFALLDDTDRGIFEKVRMRSAHTLKGSLWALGIVTGNNRQHLKKEMGEGDEPIYTGKEVQPYRLRAPRCFIHYDRAAFQQSAKEEYYRAPEKLVYKFISDRPVFALDESGALCLNSANILIPRVEGLSVRTVMALLNSRLYRYLYMKRFGGVKILKGNLEKLPLPRLTQAENEYIDAQVRVLLSGSESDEEALQRYIFKRFDMTQDEIARIDEITKGRKQS